MPFGLHVTTANPSAAWPHSYSIVNVTVRAHGYISRKKVSRISETGGTGLSITRRRDASSRLCFGAIDSHVRKGLGGYAQRLMSRVSIGHHAENNVVDGGRTMAGRIDFRKLEGPLAFQDLCERLLSEVYPDFHPVNQAGGDQGIDGFAVSGSELFQFTHTEGNVPLRKVRADLQKVRDLKGIKKWHFLCSRALSISTSQFIETQRSICDFEIVIWDGARLKAEISKHQKLVDEFFPEFAKKAFEGTEKIQEQISRVGHELKGAIRDRHKVQPRPGDAGEGLEINKDERQDILKWINDLADDEGKRTRRKPNYQREWNEFKNQFDVSHYHRLPQSKFGDAIKYLREKFYARRNDAPLYAKVYQATRGIYGIARSLGWSEEQRRAFYIQQTGNDHLERMTRKEKLKVYQAMKSFQRRIDEEGKA